ncbi:MAG: hypothetical protein ACI3T9_03165 [Romboutsia timonensis]
MKNFDDSSVRTNIYHTDTKGHKYYETTIKVYTTTDYNLFKKLEGNRAVLQKRIDKILRSIQQIGWMPAPIIVNEKFEIIDGQGRFESLKSLDAPVQFVIAEGATIEECTVMNINSTNWSLNDFVYRYATDENSINHSSYLKLQKLMELYPTIPLNLLGFAVRGVSYEGKTIKENKVNITDEMYNKAIPLLDYTVDVLNSINVTIPNHGRTKAFLLNAIMFCYNLPNIDRTRLKVSIVNNVGSPSAIWRDVYTAVLFVQNSYNKGLSAPKKIYMDTEYQKMMDLRRFGTNAKKKKDEKNNI